MAKTGLPPSHKGIGAHIKKQYASRKPSLRCKVSHSKVGIICHNRFQALQCDDVISADISDNDSVESTALTPPGQYGPTKVLSIDIRHLVTLLKK